MRDFGNWAQDLQLVDIPLHGIRYIWARLNSQSRLDRCLCTNEWLINFPELRLEGLQSGPSDHNPILLALESSVNWGPKPFRCFDVWFSNPNFKEFVELEWNNLAPLSLGNKLKALKAPLRSWSKKTFGVMESNICKLEEVIHELQKVGEQRQLDDVELARLRAAQHLLQSLLIRRERIWRQKARSYGFSSKDHNTKYFHASTIIRRKRNEISQLEIDGYMVSGVENLRREVNRYFTRRFSQENLPDFDFDMEGHSRVNEEQV